jgi:hypothetical protein
MRNARVTNEGGGQIAGRGAFSRLGGSMMWTGSPWLTPPSWRASSLMMFSPSPPRAFPHAQLGDVGRGQAYPERPSADRIGDR